MSECAIRRNVKKIQQGIGLQRKKHTKKKKLTVNQQRSLVQYALCNPKWSSKQLAIKMHDRWGISMHPTTVLSSLKSSGITKWKASKSPNLTQTQKVNRVKWCKENMETDWSRVIFSDESYFQAYTNYLKIWAKTRPSASIPKFPSKVMIWDAISLRGLHPLKVTRGHVNSESYQQILHECLITSARVLYPDGFIFQQDNATPHTSRSTKEFLKEQKVEVLPWPANSPDLNPIENLWAIMKKSVEKQDPRDTKGMERAVTLVWNNMSHEVLESLVNSMPKRISLCIAAQGEKIDY